jgi:protein TonB
MFDKYIESSSEADQNPRRTYFLVSTIIVGVLFVTGVIASLYAQDIGLGTDEFELSSMLAPVVPEAPEPPRPQPEQQQTTSDLPIRHAAIEPISDSRLIPDTPSVVPNTQREIPSSKFIIDANLPESTGANSSGLTSGDSVRGTGSHVTETEVVEPVTTVPPPVIKKVPPVVSKGVVTGLAIDLPKPVYPSPAKAVGAGGDVTVQVLIDETGNVVSAKAVNGHPLLLQESERAARRAKFRPTYLSDVPVKVTGIITYKFTK